MSIRQKVFQDVQDQHNEELDYKKFCREVFFHPGGESLRLNFKGCGFLADYLPCNVVDIVDKTQSITTMPSKHYVFLSKYSKLPYYMGKHTITFFDEEAAFLFKLCDGDIDNVKKVTD